jgi:hypothetical protein
MDSSTYGNLIKFVMQQSISLKLRYSTKTSLSGIKVKNLTD